VDESALGAGLAALGFWLFMAAVVAVGIWATVRKRDMQKELVQRMLENGQKLDQEMLDRIFPPRASAKNAGIVLVFFGFFVAAMGLAADIHYPTVTLGGLALLSGAIVWLKATR
jgi:hypothetical protein